MSLAKHLDPNDLPDPHECPNCGTTCNDQLWVLCTDCGLCGCCCESPRRERQRSRSLRRVRRRDRRSNFARTCFRIQCEKCFGEPSHETCQQCRADDSVAQSEEAQA